jgi:DNA-binding transcriptional MerR regulator
MSSLRIGALARLAGVSPDTLRSYERLKLLPKPSRSSNGYREYGPGALARVQLVQRALALGFTLAELSQVLRRRDLGETPCRRVRELAAIKLRKMERDAALLQERCTALAETLRDWDRRLGRTPRGKQARLLDHLASGPPRPAAPGPARPEFSAR